MSGDENSLFSRTVAPDFTSAFTKYEVSFTPTTSGVAHAPVDITSGTASINDLAAGTYTVTVTGYNGTADIAIGSATGVVVTNGGSTPVSITLEPKTGASSGSGSFSYDITVPTGTSSAKVSIISLDSNTEVFSSNLTGGHEINIQNPLPPVTIGYMRFSKREVKLRGLRRFSISMTPWSPSWMPRRI